MAAVGIDIELYIGTTEFIFMHLSINKSENFMTDIELEKQHAFCPL